MSVLIKSKKPEVKHPSNILSLRNVEASNKVIYDINELNLWYGKTHALKGINLSIYKGEVTAIIGPSGCGKSTFLKTLNRLIELVPNVHTSGIITYHGKSIFDRSVF